LTPENEPLNESFVSSSFVLVCSRAEVATAFCAIGVAATGGVLAEIRMGKIMFKELQKFHLWLVLPSSV
jgi:hypothetical protein